MTKNNDRISYRELQQKMLKFKEQGLTLIACNASYTDLYDEYTRVMADLEAGSVTVQVSNIINETGDEPGEPNGNPVPRPPKPGDGGSSSSHTVRLVRTNRHPAIVPMPRLGARLTQLVDRGVFTA